MVSDTNRIDRLAKSLKAVRPDFTLHNARVFARAVLGAPSEVFAGKPLEYLPGQQYWPRVTPAPDASSDESIDNWNPVRAWKQSARMEEQWQEGYALLLAYVKAGGAVPVPRRCTTDDGYRLGMWVCYRQIEHLKGTLSPDKVALLEAIPGWEWEPAGEQWKKMYEILREYLDSHGSLPADPYFTDAGYPLGRWVAAQRKRYLINKIPEERAILLESVPGWKWETLDEQWERLRSAVADYMGSHGTVPPAGYVTDDNERLDRWVRFQRGSFRESRLSADRVRRLEEIPGWTWEPSSDSETTPDFPGS